MTAELALKGARIIGFLPTGDAQRARAFYEGVLGLRFVSDDKFALVMEADGNKIRIVRMGNFQPAPYTVLGWEVGAIRTVVERLAAQGVAFARYTFMEQDELGIWTAPDGSKVAWFSDPDGNVLSVSEHPQR